MATTYDISLKISYRYEHPAAANRAILRIEPISTPEQSLIAGLVKTDPAPDFRRDGTDFFGNPLIEIAHDAPLSKVVYAFSGRVRRSARVREFDLSCALDQLPAEIAAAQSLDREAPHHFLGDSVRVKAETEIAAWTEGVVRKGMSALAAAQAVSRALHREMTFDPASTHVAMDPLKAFRNRRGVCQDLSHIMIAALRSVGVPAGYVSGFLRTLPFPGQPRLEGADAMHAWVRVWCGAEMGWAEIDPTNDQMAEDDHIVVAYGRDYADVAPVKGAMRMFGEHTTQHSVDVRTVEHAPL